MFRVLVDDAIPMNAGRLRPIRIPVPEGLMLKPRWPAAVVAGIVEVSQAVTDGLFGALGLAQGPSRTIRFLEPMSRAILSGRRRVAPVGIMGTLHRRLRLS